MMPLEPVDPTVEEVVTEQFDSLQGTVTGTLVPALFGLVILGAIIGVGVKYLRKGANKA